MPRPGVQPTSRPPSSSSHARGAPRSASEAAWRAGGLGGWGAVAVSSPPLPRAPLAPDLGAAPFAVLTAQCWLPWSNSPNVRWCWLWRLPRQEAGVQAGTPTLMAAAAQPPAALWGWGTGSMNSCGRTGGTFSRWPLGHGGGGCPAPSETVRAPSQVVWVECGHHPSSCLGPCLCLQVCAPSLSSFPGGTPNQGLRPPLVSPAGSCVLCS